MKAYTDIEQSKKLAEILPLESADMCWLYVNGEYFYEVKDGALDEEDIPAWSLSALLEVLDDEITDEEGNDYNLVIVKENLQYQLYYRHAWDQTQDIETDYYDDMIDACYEMILCLHEQNLI